MVSYRLIESPQFNDLLADVNSVTESVDRISRVAENLPETIRSEREAVLASLDEQTPEVTQLVMETHETVEDARATVEASTEAMAATTRLVESVDRFLERLGVYDQPEEPEVAMTAVDPDAPPKEPFRIQDYTEAAAQLSETARELDALVNSLDKTLATATSDEVTAKLETTITRGQEVVDHAFWRAVLLVAASCLLVLGTALLYRFLTRNRQAG